jgi:hypothetical protein
MLFSNWVIPMRRRAFLPTLLALPAASQVLAEKLRPSLFLNPDRLATLRASIQTTHAKLWAAVLKDANGFAAAKPPHYPSPPPENDEQLWQREVGNKLPFLALAYLLTGSQRYLDAAVTWSLASCSYPTWGTGNRDGIDLSVGHQLFGLALVYDWLYDQLPASARSTIHNTLLTRGNVMFQAPGNKAYWKKSILQNHLWVNLAGLTAAALALREPDTNAWTDFSRDKFRQTEAALGPDGASHEGVPYWTYGVEYLLKFWHLAGDAWNEKPTSPWWPKTAAYRLYMGLPRNSWSPQNDLIDIADGPRADYYGPDYLLRRLAHLYNDPHAQWLAAELERASATNYASRWLNLLWYDPAIPEQSPAALPTFHHFEDIGIVSARTGWTGDESLLAFKCGPPLGHAAAKFDYDAGAGHVHPDANHFVLFGAGEWLLRDDGYAWKQTDQHNTLLIDGAGQIGEGAQWFRALDAIRAHANPRVLTATSNPEYDEIIGEAASIYPANLGLKSFRRRLIFWKPDMLLVLDDIQTASPRRLELRFHPEFPAALEANALIARGPKSILRIDLLTPENVTISNGPMPSKTRDGKPSQLLTVRFETSTSQWRNITAISWCASTAVPPQVTVEHDGEKRIFHAGNRTLSI